MHERDSEFFLLKPQTQKTFSDGAKLISKWFHFNSVSEVNLPCLIAVDKPLQSIV
jgi:hypothetical protein